MSFHVRAPNMERTPKKNSVYEFSVPRSGLNYEIKYQRQPHMHSSSTIYFKTLHLPCVLGMHHEKTIFNIIFCVALCALAFYGKSVSQEKYLHSVNIIESFLRTFFVIARRILKLFE